jgi:hypothetical protein
MDQHRPAAAATAPPVEIEAVAAPGIAVTEVAGAPDTGMEHR